MLTANTEMDKNTANRSRSAVDRMENPKKGDTVKKSRQAVEISEQKTAGPEPMKRAVNRTAASNREKRWRCKTGEKVQRLSATQTAMTAPAYRTHTVFRCRTIQLLRIVSVPDIAFRRLRRPKAGQDS